MQPPPRVETLGMHETLRIEEIVKGRGLAEFSRLPYELYAGDPYWAPPIRLQERRAYEPGRNAVLDRSPKALLAARRGKRLVGRIVAYADPRYNAYFGSRTGFFGSFECADDPEAASALFAAAEAWFRAQGLDRVRGAINPVAECWGFLVDGFTSPPVYLSPHNPPRYPEYAAAAGYAKAKDLLAYEADGGSGYRIPERFSRFSDILAARRPGLSTRPLDPRELERDAEHVRSILNAGVEGNWGYVPVERDEMAAVVRELRPVLDPAAVWFVEDEGRPVACCLGFPDINVILRKVKGRLFPTGALRLLLGARRLRDYRLWGLAVLPEYQGQGLDVLLYLRLFEALAPRGVRLEANYILEDNYRIRNALEKLGMRPVKRYRVFEKGL